MHGGGDEHLMSSGGRTGERTDGRAKGREEVFHCVLANEKLTGISFPFLHAAAKSFLIYVS